MILGASVASSVSSKRCSPPKVFRTFLTQFWRISDAFWNVPLFPIKQDPFWRIFDAFLTHSCYCRRLFRKHLLDDTDAWLSPFALCGLRVPKLRKRLGCTQKGSYSAKGRVSAFWAPSLDGGNSALVIGFWSRPILGPQKHYFKRHFGASKIVLTKARLLKHDFPVHGLLNVFYETLPSKNLSKKLVFTENPYRRLLRTLLRSTYLWRTFSDPF